MRKLKTVNEIVQELCARETGKAEVNIAQMREIVGQLADMLRSQCGGHVTLARYGARRQAAREKRERRALMGKLK